MPRPGKKPAGEASNSNKKCKRYFNEQWKGEFPWLEFDYDRKLMFCVACRRALEAIVKVLHDEDSRRMTDSPFIGLIVRGAVDLLENEKLVLFVSTVSPFDRHASVMFLGLFDLPDGETETVVDRLVEIFSTFSVPLSKVSWLAYDEPSLSTNKISNAVSRLKPLCPLLKHFPWLSSNDCLALSDIIRDVAYLRKYEETVDAVFRLFSSYEDDNNSLEELDKVLKSSKIDLRDCKPVQWASVLPAVEAINSLWPTLVLFLEELAGKSPLALGLCKELKKFNFVAFTKVLMDVLPILQRLSAFFRAEELNLSVLKPVISASLACLKALRSASGCQFQEFLCDMNEHPQEDCEKGVRLYYKGVEMTNCSQEDVRAFGQLKDAYLGTLCKSLQDRLPEDIVELVNAFVVLFSPQCYVQALVDDIKSYGATELNLLLDQYGGLVSQERARTDFPLFKRVVVSLGHLSLQQLCAQLVFIDSEMRELFPDFATLASLASVLPVQPATCEKVFRAKDQTKKLLTEEGLSNVVKIAVDGPTISEFDFEAAIEHYETIKDKQNVV
ncbi:uncharacterized protein C17orf113-like isoform X2 [Lepisosteus oculatus]|uniref:uncharacterized protein C17orf113-like isoform X2 n=1 Tax=Lepisosteus oculatus TaxID=7918 RepID=UPI00371CF17F